MAESKKSTSPKMDEAKDHLHAAHDSMKKSVEAWLPDGFVEHRRAARKEMLLAMRSLLDAAIEHTEKAA